MDWHRIFNSTKTNVQVYMWRLLRAAERTTDYRSVSNDKVEYHQRTITLALDSKAMASRRGSVVGGAVGGEKY